MYENKTESNLISSMLASINNDYSKIEGSFVYDLIAAMAVELGVSYAELERVLMLGFAQTSSGIYLEYKAAERGLTRKPATKATGKLTITGNNGAVIPAGSLFETAGGIQFKTLQAYTITTTGSIEAIIEALVAGISGNVPANSIIKITTSIAGVTDVTNIASTEGGTDIETDSALLERLLEEVQKPISSGNKYHYEKWAKEVPGVGDAKCLPLWAGAGTVKVVLLDSEKLPASSTIVTATSVYIQSQRPVGADVTVVSATPVNINVTATITKDALTDIDDIVEEFKSKLKEYLKQQAFVGLSISYLKIGSLILETTGVLSCPDLKVNNGVVDIQINTDEVAVTGAVSISE